MSSRSPTTLTFCHLLKSFAQKTATYSVRTCGRSKLDHFSIFPPANMEALATTKPYRLRGVDGRRLSENIRLFSRPWQTVLGADAATCRHLLLQTENIISSNALPVRDRCCRGLRTSQRRLNVHRTGSYIEHIFIFLSPCSVRPGGP